MSSLFHRKWARRLASLSALALCFGPFVSTPAAAAPSAANLAMIAEPQTLDPMVSTADLVGTIMQHVYEPLYTYDANWNVVPMLADGLPRVSDDGLTHEIALRQGVQFHNGREMNSDDVVASLKRWLETSPRGKAIAAEVVSVEARGPYAIELKLKTLYAPLLSQLALPTSMAAIMARETIAPQVTDFIGTGPYRFKERRPDQYTLLTRFDGYSARAEPASGHAGKREALIDELRFVPVPSANTRVEGALAGQFDFADLLPVESIDRLERAGAAVVPIMTQSFGFPYLAFNTKEGVLASRAMRQAVQTAFGEGEMMAAAFGDTRFFTVEANHFPQGTPFFSTAGADQYNRRDPAAAREMAARAGYDGQPVHIMASRQYEFHYNMALVMAEQLKRAGIKAELQIVDWATLVQRRNDPKLWDIYVTHSPVFPEPMLSPPQLNEGAPGWWSSPAKQAALSAMNQEIDPTRRGALWGKVQQVIYDEVPYINVGKFNSLSARSQRLQGYVPSAWPFFWNATVSRK
jgi:peptide/nickel transport system substrate-binding protein